ncbi:cupin domain-containing protein [Halomonas organivorans]|uniref:Quercetin dioxygenase-like cupin family protein n=1 Tax=Halomonas organivorans TaxID=257772 RepID=A0A7W5G5D0_9GAMM|nr:cupin domain-containing protein [Halomonas organivorans]MBB3140822.1 quercetin dioxygenase-like cupin family protein [Halomonas organivorans]
MTHSAIPAVATRQIEDDGVIVTRWDFAPGAQTGWHRHALDYVVVPLVDGVMRLETDAGSGQERVSAGVSYRRPAGVEHNVINAGEDAFAFVEIELKGTHEGS